MTKSTHLPYAFGNVTMYSSSWSETNKCATNKTEIYRKKQVMGKDGRKRVGKREEGGRSSLPLPPQKKYHRRKKVYFRLNIIVRFRYFWRNFILQPKNLDCILANLEVWNFKKFCSAGPNHGEASLLTTTI